MAPHRECNIKGSVEVLGACIWQMQLCVPLPSNPLLHPRWLCALTVCSSFAGLLRVVLIQASWLWRWHESIGLSVFGLWACSGIAATLPSIPVHSHAPTHHARASSQVGVCSPVWAPCGASSLPVVQRRRRRRCGRSEHAMARGPGGMRRGRCGSWPRRRVEGAHGRTSRVQCVPARVRTRSRKPSMCGVYRAACVPPGM